MARRKSWKSPWPEVADPRLGAGRVRLDHGSVPCQVMVARCRAEVSTCDRSAPGLSRSSQPIAENPCGTGDPGRARAGPAAAVRVRPVRLRPAARSVLLDGHFRPDVSGEGLPATGRPPPGRGADAVPAARNTPPAACSGHAAGGVGVGALPDGSD